MAAVAEGSVVEAAAMPRKPQAAPPSGTVTFLFTDIEGSTERWERDRAAMQDAVRRHDALMRDAIAGCGGYVFKTIGDAFCAAFARAEDAAAAAFNAQCALAEEDFAAVDGVRARIAIHVGTADERDGDYFGPVVNRVARLLAIGNGGQTLLSGVAYELIAERLPRGATVRDLGSHRLKDLTSPEHVYQLLPEGESYNFPPLRSLDAHPNNLPAQATALLGREADLEAITTALAAHRLVTIVGAGGVGKTRTSLQAGANLLEKFTDGVWFIELAAIADPSLVPNAVTLAAELNVRDRMEPVEALVAALRSRSTLLIFDNCEHLLDAVAHAVAAILRQCPHVVVLTSSRQPLGIDGENVYRLPSLPAPSEEEAASLAAEDALQFPAVALFVERAKANDTRFRLDDANVPIIADIVRRLDGIPLAVELAAARVRVLTPQELRSRLNERFRLLTGGSRAALPRQQTLLALVDWSYELLSDKERLMLQRVAIFAGTWSLEGAESVCSGGAIDAFDILDLMASLVDKSLVLCEERGASTRYRLLETTRAFALEKLESKERDEVSGRLAGWSARVVTDSNKARTVEGGTLSTIDYVRVLDAEADNIRAAVMWSLERDDFASTAGEIVAGIGAYWFNRSLRELRSWVHRALDVVPATQELLRAKLSLTAAYVSHSVEQVRFARSAVQTLEAEGTPRTLASALNYLALGLRDIGETREAADVAERMLALHTEQGLPKDGAFLHRLIFHGVLLGMLGDWEGARADYDAARHIFPHVSDVLVAAMSLAELGKLSFLLRERGRAIDEANEALRMAEGVIGIETDVYSTLPGYYLAGGNVDEARTAARKGCLLAVKFGVDGYVETALEHLAAVAAVSGRHATAATLAGYTHARKDPLQRYRSPAEQSSHDILTRVLNSVFSSEEQEALRTRGAALTEEDAIALAFSDHVTETEVVRK